MKVNWITRGLAAGSLALVISGCSATAQSDGGSNVLHRIPLETTQGRTLFSASIDGSDPALFMLDTGGSDGVFTRAYVDSAGLRSGEPQELRSPLGGNVEMVDTAVYDSIAFGDLTLSGRSALIIEEGRFPVPGGNGVVSLNPFRDYIVEFDLGASELRVVSAPGTSVATWLPHPEDATFLSLDLEVAGETIPAHIDSGNPGMITLPLEFAEHLSLEGELREAGRFRTVDAERIFYEGTLLAPIDIGGIMYAPETVRFAELPFANIGSAVLMNWVLVIDGPGERFGLYERD